MSPVVSPVLAALAAVAFLVFALTPLPAVAGMSGSCRVPDVYLTFNNFLPRTTRLIDRAAPVRILVIGPQMDERILSSRKLSKLAQELQRRLPGARFTILEEDAVPGLAREDFDRIRASVERTEPDLLIWQVGSGDALAGTSDHSFSDTLDEAAEWLRGRDIDLILVDPPFLPNVRHEKRYGRIVQQMDSLSDKESLNVLQQYGATTYLFSSPQSGARGSAGRLCLPELLAEAIVRSALR
ncbi:hypothetical protein [Aquabacter cavernae]|uniref:hypothetical protein n=1 Tax=Aquabacter cavernae TaxID=2496029 RepID=UPI000F8C6033|nr:hypothetical protein [Aquabacter cavernae]